MINQLKKWNNATDGPRKYEWILAGVLLFVSAFFFCFKHDFYLTVNHSLTFDSCLLNGKLLRYYSIVNHQALTGVFSPEWPSTLLSSANYSIINYASFGIICLPVYLIGKVFDFAVPFLVYETLLKIMYIVLDLYMAKVVYDICDLMNFDRIKTKWITFLFITSPVLLFSSTMITHLDIFCVVFFLLGLRSLLKKNRRCELVFFMIAVAYKPFVILGIIPIVLLKEKRVLYLIRDAVVIVFGVLLQNGIYHFDPGYAKSQRFMSKTYDFVGRFFSCNFDFTKNFYKDDAARASVFVVMFCVICVVAYSVKAVKKQYLFAFPMFVWCGFVLFVGWHPNWLLLMVPFLSFIIGFSYQRKILLLLQGAFSALFMVMSAIGWQGNYDNNIISGGVFSQLLGWKANPTYEIGAVLNRKMGSIPMELYGSLLCGITASLGVVVLLDAYRTRKKVKVAEHENTWERGVIWISICPIVVYILYSVATCIL